MGENDERDTIMNEIGLNADGKIPKIIHYCWFGGKPLPENLQRCLDSWKKLEGYQIIRWDESNCSFQENEFVRRACKEKKLAFVADYYRLKAVYEYGGIYFDTDVMVYKSFDALLNYPAFVNFIFDCSVGTAIIGAQKGSPFIGRLLEMYDKTVFAETQNGKVLEWRNGNLIVNRYVTNNYYYTYYILKKYPQFKLNNRFQNMGDFVIFPKEYFEIGMLTGRQYAIHLCAGEWRPQDAMRGSIKDRIKYHLAGNEKLYSKIQIFVRRIRYRKLCKKIPFYAYAVAQKKHLQLPEL